MKTRMIIICFVMLNLFQQSNLKAQHYVTIPDTAFARYLRNTYPSCMNGNQMDTTCTAITSATTFSNILFYQFVDLTGIQYFNHLLTLDCSNINTITTIPKLPPLLTSLNVMDNQLTVLPALPNSLTYLECEQNQLTSLPALPNTLQTLYFSMNPIISLPALPSSLQILNCAHDSITSLPVLSASLTDLSCQNNKLTTLPALPSGITYVYANNNRLTSIPTLPASLLQIGFSNNQVTIVPPLPASLNYLEFSNNHVSTIPTLPNTLTRFYCDNNQISNMPALPTGITDFYCNNNLLTSLPTLPTALQMFYCNNNQLSVLPALPPSLTDLYCSYNQLTYLPSLPASLTDLNCGFNQLTYLPTFPASLNSLDCSNNYISCFPPFPSGLLFSINITGNPFTCLPNYTQHMSSSLLAYPLCVSGDIIHNPNGCANSKGITGDTYKDNNANCTFDVSDTGINHFSLKTFDNSGTLLAQSYSYYDGRYFFQDSIGTFTISLDTAGMPFTVLCPHPGVDSTLILSTANPLAKNVNFAIACKPGFDIGVQSIRPRKQIFPGRPHELVVNAGDLSKQYNLNCAAGVGGQVQITVSGLVTFDSIARGTLTPAIAGNVFTYTIADFGVIPFNDFGLWFTTDTTATIGDSICVSVVVTPTAGDNNTSNNTINYCYYVGNSYDPNEKETYPVNVQPGYNDYFTYTVQFQNTGTAAAHNISVTDTLSSLFDLSTFQLLDYSNANITSILGNTLIVRFPNINLVDSTVSADSSIGYFQYRIKPKSGLPAGTQIFNKANIYFDYNAPVITNTTVNNYVLTTGINKVQNATLSIYPNPSNGKYFVNISDAKDVSKLTIEVTNLLGESIYKSLILNPKSELDLSNQANGVYFVRIIGGEQSLNKKIVKQ